MDVNQYTLAFDIRLPMLGVYYALMNTNPTNSRHGDVWINKSGQVGQDSYSTEQLQANVWYRVVFSANLSIGERKYYVNGRLVHRQSGEKLDGHFSVYSVQAEHPFLTLFADSNGDSAPIDVQQVALWNYTLPDNVVEALGGPKVKVSR